MIHIYADFFNRLFNDKFIHIMFWVIVFDIFTGIIKGVYVQKKGSSYIGIKGLVRNFGVYAFIVLGEAILYAFNLDTFIIVFIGFFLYMYFYSIGENFEEMGIDLWKPINFMVQKIKETYVESEDKKDDNNK